jgi:hypothetical protein
METRILDVTIVYYVLQGNSQETFRWGCQVEREARI